MIYVIGSDIYKKNIYKIGYSTQTIQGLRSRYATYLGEPKIIYTFECHDYQEKEKLIHEKLHKYRIWKNRELFDCKYFIINYNLSKIDGRYSKMNWITKKIYNLKYKLYT
jgi:hypothetical protein